VISLDTACKTIYSGEFCGAEYLLGHMGRREILQLGGCPSERHLGFVRSSLKPICCFGGVIHTPTGIAKKTNERICHYWQLRASITLIIMANIYLLTFHGSYGSEGLPCWPDPQEQACLANYETSVCGSSVYILPLAHSFGFPDMWAYL
jgi:hypothetical protein